MSSVRKLAAINQKTIIKKKYYRDSLGFKITIWQVKKKKFFRPLEPQFGLKIRGGARPLLAPPLDPLDCKRLDLNVARIIKQKWRPQVAPYPAAE